MPRHARRVSSCGMYHIMLRGINRQSIFEEDEDRKKFIECLEKYKMISQYKLFAYCLMDNHVHLLLQENQESIGVILQRISSSYVHWYNRKYRRCGHLFQERFKSEVIENDSYFLTVLRYVHQNPLKAKIVNCLSEYPWSSYNGYMNNEKTVDKEYVLKLFSNEQDEAVRRFIKFIEEVNEDQCLEIEEGKISLSDEGIKKMFKQQFGIEVIHVCNEGKEKQDYFLYVLKNVYGLTIRRIARITGISATRVWQA